MPNILYLHGFASGPSSQKARFFYNQFEVIGADVHIPDLVPGPFRDTTVSSQLEIVERAAAEIQPCLIIGSSLGGYLAALYAARHPELPCGVVLLAPAFDFVRRWSERLGEMQLEAWRERGELAVYHYGEQGMSAIGYPFYEDALRHETAPRITQPTLIFHGQYDDVVESASSVEYTWRNLDAELLLLESDHQLLDVLQPIWDRMLYFYRKIEPF